MTITYDYLISKSLGDHHYRNMYFERKEMSDSKIEVYKYLHKITAEFVESPEELPNRTEIQQCLSIIENILNASDVNDDLDNKLATVNECFDVIEYFGVEVKAFRRDEQVLPAENDKPVRAYLFKIDGTRIAPALGIASEDIANGSTTGVVMELFESKIRLDANLESILRLDTIKDNWRLMDSAGVGASFDVSKLIELLSDRGMKLMIFLK